MSVIEYKPVAGLPIRNALYIAKKMAAVEGTAVIADINDVIMRITKNTDVDEALKLYLSQYAFKLEIENIKRER